MQILTYIPYSQFTFNGCIVTLERAESIYDREGNLPKGGTPFKPAYYWQAVLVFADGYRCSFGKGGKGGPGGKQIVKRKAIAFIEAR